jgi:hypothetical protein
MVPYYSVTSRRPTFFAFLPSFYAIIGFTEGTVCLIDEAIGLLIIASALDFSPEADNFIASFLA